jgi:hypothetical protein
MLITCLVRRFECTPELLSCTRENTIIIATAHRRSCTLLDLLTPELLAIRLGCESNKEKGAILDMKSKPKESINAKINTLIC